MLLILTTAAFAEPPSYRIAGISFSTDGPSYAVVEIGKNQQKLVREGASFAPGATLTQVDEYAVTLEIDGKRYRLPLKGDLSTLDDLDLVEEHIVTTAELDLATARSAFDRLVAQGKAQGAALNEVFGLPKKARIVGVNHNLVQTDQAVVKAIQAGFEAGLLYKFEISGVADLDEVYLVPPESNDS